MRIAPPGSPTRFSQNGRTVFANTTAAQVPASLGGVVGAVLGLNDAGRFLAGPRTAQGIGDVIGLPKTYTPQGYQTAYDVAGTPTGADTSIGVFAWGDVRQTVTDLRTAEVAFGLPQVPVTVVQVGAPGTDTAGVEEWDLDTQYSSGMAQTVSQLYLYTTTSATDADIALEINRFAADDLARAGSGSFGLCEVFPALDGAMLAMDNAFLQAAALGQTVFFSSGDTGGFCPVGTAVNGVPAGAPLVNYPAASTFAVAVGGTTLLTNADNTYSNELAWLAGGGGTSVFEPAAAWQSGVIPTTAVGKGLPDVAMVADPNSGAHVFFNGADQAGVGGTSLSSPLALGVWARLLSAHGGALGFGAPSLYAARGTAGFHDVTLGDTGPWPAAPGWDFATGLGTFDVARMNATIH